MTQERLRELLRERVADETMPDYSLRAWRAARVVRRRRRLGAASGVVAATVAISAGIAAVDSTPPGPRKPAEPAATDVTPTPTPDATPDATYEGVPVWWSPDQFEEDALPAVDSALPAEIELAGRPEEPVDRALAAFAHGRSVTLVGADGAMHWVDLSRLQDVTKPNGYSYFPADASMLSPTGAYLAFLQPGQVAVYAVATGEWTDVDVSGGVIDVGGGGGLMLTWTGADEFVVSGPLGGLGSRYDVTGRDLPGERVGPVEPAFDWPPAQPYGRDVRSPRQVDAQSWGMGVPLPVRDAGSYVSDPEFLVASGSVLAFMDRLTDGLSDRFKNCCPAAGWLDDSTVVYESRQALASRLVSWRVGTDEFGLVSRIQGRYDVASFAL